MKALGMIEVYSFTTAVCVADTAAKAADVRIIAFDRNRPLSPDVPAPLVMVVKIEGDVAAVRAAVEYAETRLEVSHLNAFIRKGNISSVKLVEKLDFKYLMETVLDGFDYVIYRRENASV